MKYLIACEDCFSFMNQLPENKIDVVLCDLPYGMTKNVWDTPLDLQQMWQSLWRVCKPDTNFIFHAQQPFSSLLVTSNITQFKQALVWRKNKASGFLNANRRHLQAHEDILVFCGGKSFYSPQKSTGHKPSNYARQSLNQTENYNKHDRATYTGGQTERFPVSVLDFKVVNNDGSNGGRFHPTQKPTDLLIYLLESFSPRDCNVLDFTMGSGSTGVAALQSGRNFFGCDTDRKYFTIARERLAELVRE